jgi:hypothetical protein
MTWLSVIVVTGAVGAWFTPLFATLARSLPGWGRVQLALKVVGLTVSAWIVEGILD